MAVIPKHVEAPSNEERWTMWLQVTFAALAATAAGYMCVTKVLDRLRKASGSRIRGNSPLRSLAAQMRGLIDLQQAKDTDNTLHTIPNRTLQPPQGMRRHLVRGTIEPTREQFVVLDGNEAAQSLGEGIGNADMMVQDGCVRNEAHRPGVDSVEYAQGLCRAGCR
jgi:hypothetical protein